MPKIRPRLLSLDCETTGLDLHHGARPFLVTFCDEAGVNTWFEWDVDPLTRLVKAPPEDLQAINDMIMGADVLVLQNSKFDYTGLRLLMDGLEGRPKLWWDWGKVRDTLLAGHLLASNHRHDLTSMAMEYLAVDVQPYEDAMEAAVKDAKKWALIYRRRWRLAKKGLPEMPSARGGSQDKHGEKKDPVWKYDCWLPKAVAIEERYPKDHPWRTITSEYANSDSSVTLALWKVQDRLIKERRLEQVYANRLKLLPVIAKVEQSGMTVSRKRFDDLSARLIDESDYHHHRCLCMADHEIESLPVNGCSNALKRVLFEKFKLKSPKLTPNGQPSTDKYVLDHWQVTLPQRSKQLMFVQSLLAYRRRKTALGYLDSYHKYWLPTEDSDTMVIYSSLNPTGTDTLRFSSENPNEQQICFDGETEVLTKQGWLCSKDLTSGVEIAQYQSGSKAISFVFPVLHHVRYKGEMVHITTDKQVDMLLTPMHRCLVQSRRPERYRDVRAVDFPSDCKHFHAGIYSSGKDCMSRHLIRWFCAVQADGHYVRGRGLKTCGILFGLRKKRKVKALQECLDEMKVKYKKTFRSGSHWFYIGAKHPLVIETKRLMPDKCFGPWLLQYDRETLFGFAKEVFLWDGDSTRKSSYGSSVEKNAVWIQILFVLTGSRAGLTKRHPNNTWLKNAHYTVNVTLDQDYSLTTNFSKEMVPWDDNVYCVSVPSTYVLIRRNNRVSVTGNSKQKDVNLRYIFGPPPGREWYSIDASNIELRIPAYEAGERSMIDLFEHPDDPPYFGSNHLLFFDILHHDKFTEVVCEKCLGSGCRDDDGGIIPCGRRQPLCDIKGGVKRKYTSTWYSWTKNGDFACVPMSTEALTRQGWKKYSQLKVGDYVLGHRDGHLEWTPILHLGLKKSRLMRLSNNNFSVTTTPDHRWFGRHRIGGRRTRRYVNEFFTSAEVIPERELYLSFPTRDTAILPITDTEAAIIGFAYGDGMIEKSGKSSGPSRGGDGQKVGFRVRLCQSKPSGIKYLRSLFKAWGKPVTSHVSKSGVTIYSLDTNSVRDTWRRAGLWHNPKNANLEEFVLKIGSSQREAFLEAVFMAEGWLDRRGYKLYAQNTGIFAESIKLASFMTGNFPRTSKRNASHYNYIRKDGSSGSNKINLAIRSGVPRVTGQRLQKTMIPGMHDVWCVTTSLGTWVMRQNGRIMLTGNCQYGAVAESGTADRAYHVLGAQAKIESHLVKVKQLSLKMIKLADKHGYVETMPDRTVDPEHGYPLLCTRSKWGGVTPTVPLSYHVQGTAMWWMSKAMVRCQEYLDDYNAPRKPECRIRMIAQIHDELVFDCPANTDTKSVLSPIKNLKRLMEQGGDDIGIPTPVNVEKHAICWDEGEGVVL